MAENTDCVSADTSLINFRRPNIPPITSTTFRRWTAVSQSCQPLQQEELVFAFLLLLSFSKNKHDLLVDNWTLEHPLLSIPFKLLLLLLKKP